MQAEQQSERERFTEADIRNAWRAWPRQAVTGADRAIEFVRFLEARAALSHPSTPQGWQPISTAPEGELVVVGWLDGEDTEHPERHDFDWLEDGAWQKHSADHEYFLMVAPPGSRGPSEDAPYTHWQRIGPIPAPLPPEQGGKG